MRRRRYREDRKEVRDEPLTGEHITFTVDSFSTLNGEKRSSSTDSSSLYRIGTSKDVLVQDIFIHDAPEEYITDGTNRPDLSKIDIHCGQRTPFPNRVRKSQLEKQVNRVALISRLESFTAPSCRSSFVLRRCHFICLSEVFLKLRRVFTKRKQSQMPELTEATDDVESMVCTIDFITPWDSRYDKIPSQSFLLEDNLENGPLHRLTYVYQQIINSLCRK